MTSYDFLRVQIHYFCCDFYPSSTRFATPLKSPESAGLIRQSDLLDGTVPVSRLCSMAHGTVMALSLSLFLNERFSTKKSSRTRTLQGVPWLEAPTPPRDLQPPGHPERRSRYVHVMSRTLPHQADVTDVLGTRPRVPPVVSSLDFGVKGSVLGRLTPEAVRCVYTEGPWSGSAVGCGRWKGATVGAVGSLRNQRSERCEPAAILCAGHVSAVPVLPEATRLQRWRSS